MKKNQKIAGIALASLLTMSGNQAGADSQVGAAASDRFARENDLNRTIELPGSRTNSPIAKQQLIDALKSMKSNPETIEFHSAMCYKVSMDPETVDYSCPGCGKQTTHPYHSNAGQLSREVASIKRSLKNLPAAVSMDETSLCSHCRKTTETGLYFTTQCGECKTEFNWKITNGEDLAKMDWLFLKYPITAVDDGPGRGPLKDPDKVRKMVEFVSEKLFCPACIKKHNLNYNEKKQ